MACVGKNMAVKVTARVLQEFLPPVEGLDWEVVAVKIVEAIDSGAVALVYEREQAMQEALAATMKYMGSVRTAQHERIQTLEAERSNLHMELLRLRQAPPVPVASR